MRGVGVPGQGSGARVFKRRGSDIGVRSVVSAWQPPWRLLPAALTPSGSWGSCNLGEGLADLYLTLVASTHTSAASEPGKGVFHRPVPGNDLEAAGGDALHDRRHA